MKGRKMIAVWWVLVVLAGPAAVCAQGPSSIPSYYDQLQFNLTAPSARATAMGGFANPAVYGVLPGFESQFSWTDRDNRFRNLKEWGLFLGAPWVGFGMTRNEVRLPDGREAGVNDYRIGFAGGTRRSTLGIGYGWSGGDDDLLGRSSVFQVGIVQRFGRYASLGLAGSFAIENSNQVGLADVAIRPLGDDRITVFADAELAKDVRAADAPWSAGAMLEPIAGLQLAGRYFDDDSYAFSVGVSFGGLRLAGSPRFDKDNNTTNTTYEIRSGYIEPSAIRQAIERDRYYLRMNMKGNLKYRGYRFFDRGTHRLLHVLTDLDHARKDPAISGVALNLSGAVMSRGKAWELREKLADVQRSGKHVVIFVDDVNMTTLHLASVADRVVMDPQGIALIPGYVMGRTFVRDLMEKIGVGFDEWRFLEYKSAAEALSRSSMSDADREQRLALLEDLYATVRNDVATSRGVTHDMFDAWINDRILLSPEQAKEMGIVDHLGRWEDVKDIVKELEGSSRRYVDRGRLSGNLVKSRQWGLRPRIAVVYALGACEMDTGIRARRLRSTFERLRGDESVAAVVLRVDSPGGLAIAADWVAESMKKCAERKPVIVSQGDLAASGGYWLSMYGTEIVALPNTIVGSIGVIGGWVYNDGIGEKLGHVADHVQVGENADYGFGIRLLMSGPQIPDKNLSPDQREKVIDLMKVFYEDFVETAAEARDIPVDEMHAIAEGRVFSGTRGQAVGLVDRIGGLDVAIASARAAAGIDPDREVEIVELPEMSPFKLRLRGPLSPFQFLLGGEVTGDDDESLVPEWSYIRAILDAPGRPLFMLPPEMDVYEPGVRR